MSRRPNNRQKPAAAPAAEKEDKPGFAARKVAALAEARARPIAFHDCSGPVTLAVSTHLALSLRNVKEQEIARGFYYAWYQDFVDHLPPIANGLITVPGGPGLGMDLLPGLTERADAIHRISRSD